MEKRKEQTVFRELWVSGAEGGGDDKMSAIKRMIQILVGS